MPVKVDTYTSSGAKKSTKSTLPVEFGSKVNEDLLAQALRVYEWQMHTGSSVAKTRSEVTASTRKIYRQKGTGRARHGAISAPLFVGGGKAHGPRGVRRSLSLPKAMRAKAKASAFAKKLADNKLVAAEISGIKKTKAAAALLKKLADDKTKFTVAFAQGNKEVKKAFRNIENVKVESFKNLNPYNIVFGGFLVIDAEAVSAKKPKGAKKS